MTPPTTSDLKAAQSIANHWADTYTGLLWKIWCPHCCLYHWRYRERNATRSPWATYEYPH